MKKLIISMVLAGFGCVAVMAETSVWKVQKESSVMYLGGTCHVLRDTDYPLPPEFDQAYKAAEVVVFETDISKLHDSAIQQKLMAQAVYADGSTIEQHLSAAALGEISAYCASNNIPLQAFKSLKPGMLMMMITMMELMKLGVTQQGVDLYYHRSAANDKKAVAGLETVEFQINFLVSMADGNEDEFVIHALKDMSTLKQQFEELIQSWRKGDEAKLSELMVEDLKAKMPKLYKKLITDRNANWLKAIESYQKTPQPEFILVGAAHLVGPEGLIETLRKKGFKVNKL